MAVMVPAHANAISCVTMAVTRSGACAARRTARTDATQAGAVCARKGAPTAVMRAGKRAVTTCARTDASLMALVHARATA